MYRTYDEMAAASYSSVVQKRLHWLLNPPKLRKKKPEHLKGVPTNLMDVYVDFEDLMKLNNTFKSLEKVALMEAFVVRKRIRKHKHVSSHVLQNVSRALKVISTLREEHATIFFGKIDTAHAYSVKLYRMAADEIFQDEGKALNILLSGKTAPKL